MGFALPEALFAFQFPDDRNARAGARLDLVVGIDERALQPARNRPAHGGFSCPHESDEKYVRVCVPGLQLGSFAINLVLFVRQLKGKPAALSSLEGLSAGFVSPAERPRAA